MSNLEMAGRIGIALVLCSAIGAEREVRQKSAGLRTHTLVGLGACVAMLVSKYGFADLVNGSGYVLDPSRLAAQVVSGVGFIGAGLIFVRKDNVRGLTTAATVWLTAMVGLAVGAGLLVVAVAGALGHFVVVLGQPFLARSLPSGRSTTTIVGITYEDARGVLRDVLTLLTTLEFTVTEVEVDRPTDSPGLVRVFVEVAGAGEPTELAVAIGQLDGVHSVDVGAPRPELS